MTNCLPKTLTCIRCTSGTLHQANTKLSGATLSMQAYFHGHQITSRPRNVKQGSRATSVTMVTGKTSGRKLVK